LISIKHNATYLPLKSDLRLATAEEILKYKDANKHGRKRAPGTASTGEASASGTTLEPEGLAGPSKEHNARKSKGDLQPTSDKGGRRDRGRVTKAREDKESCKDSSRDDARKARETADEKDAAEDEADKREYLALQNKMEARRIAREIQTAHNTLASLRAEQEDVSAKSETVPKARVVCDQAKDRDALVSKGEIKKPRATRPAVRTSVSESVATSTTKAPRRVEEQVKAKPMKMGEGKRTDIGVEPKRTVNKSGAKRPTSATEPSHKTAEKTTTHSSDEDSRTEVLGPALVAGAIGRKIGNARTATMMRGITECRVKLLSTRQKAKLPVPAAPNNSAESNCVVDFVGTYDVDCLSRRQTSTCSWSFLEMLPK